jgi:molecular chaperone DnaK (HSP70)
MVVGIDFGTTNSVVSVYNTISKKCEILCDKQGNTISPTCFSQDDNNTLLFGNECNQFSPRLTNIKRYIGVKYSDVQDSNSYWTLVKDPNSDWVAFKRGDTVFSLIDLISQYLKYLVKENNCHVVLTVPAKFTDVERNIMKKACEMANLNVLRLINEPTAAALAYFTLDDKLLNNETILVLDCGGGTTDVSVVNMDYEESFFQVESTVGDSFLGGEDITNSLINYVIDCTSISSITIKQRELLKLECENAKKRLSLAQSTYICIEEMGTFLTISRAKLIHLNKAFFDKIRSLIDEASFGFTIDKYILVGGSTRFPYFKQIIKEIAGENIVICDSLDPEHTVSIGAAYQGYLLSAKDNLDLPTVIDVVGSTIGIETIGGIMTPIISKNNHIPTSNTQLFTNDKDNVDEITINIYAGDRKLCCHNTFLGALTLSGLDKSLKKGEMNIRVNFDVDSNGILSVSAVDSKTNANSRFHTSTKAVVDVESDFEEIMSDSIEANRIIAKRELYQTFLRLLCFFHVNRATFVDEYHTKRTNFHMSKLNQLFNYVFNILQNKNVSIKQINETQATFEREWNTYIVNMNSNDDNQKTTVIT